jgi:hypothetical protein
MAEQRSSDLDKDTVTKAYAKWAPVYDLVFGAVFERGRQAAIVAAERIGGASSKSASALASRCRIIRARTGSAASTFPNRC